MLKQVQYLMEIFLDTSNIDSILEWDKKGFISGVTTNPALLSKEKGKPKWLTWQDLKKVKEELNLT